MNKVIFLDIAKMPGSAAVWLLSLLNKMPNNFNSSHLHCALPTDEAQRWWMTSIIWPKCMFVA